MGATMSCAVLCSLHSCMNGTSHLLSDLKYSVELCIASFRIKIIYMFSRHFVHTYEFCEILTINNDRSPKQY